LAGLRIATKNAVSGNAATALSAHSVLVVTIGLIAGAQFAWWLASPVGEGLWFRLAARIGEGLWFRLAARIGEGLWFSRAVVVRGSAARFVSLSRPIRIGRCVLRVADYAEVIDPRQRLAA
jgi:hypothetical protein